MPKYFSKPIQVTLFLLSVLQTGIVLVLLQICAWFMMTHDLSKEVSIVEAVKLVSGAKKTCGICEFVSKSNIAEKDKEPVILLYELPLLGISSTQSGFVDSIIGVALPNIPEKCEFASLSWDVDPPPPKLVL